MKGRRQTSRTFNVRSNASHVWASQRGETRMKVPFDVSIFFTTLLRRAIGGEDICKREVPPLGQSVYSFWVVGGVLAVEALCLLGGFASEEVDFEETPSGRIRLEHKGVKMSVWNLLETRCCIC
jgi:hypothetical protein